MYAFPGLSLLSKVMFKKFNFILKKKVFDFFIAECQVQVIKFYNFFYNLLILVISSTNYKFSKI